MKKNTLIQLILIYMGLTCLYFSVYNILQTSFAIAWRPDANFNDYSKLILASYIVFAIIGLVVIFRSGALSRFISKYAGVEQNLTVFTTPRQLLSILIVVTALAHLIDYLPSLIKNGLDVFIDSQPERLYDDKGFRPTPEWGLSLMHVVFPCLMIIFARNLTNYFAKNIVLDDEDVVVASSPPFSTSGEGSREEGSVD